MFQTTNQWILRCPKYPNTFFGCSPHFLLLTCGFCREVISTPPRRYHPEHVMQNKSSQTRNQQNKWCRPEATFFYAYDSYDHDISPLFSPEIQAQKTSTMVIYPLNLLASHQFSLTFPYWLVVSTLWKIWVRQLGWWHSQLNGKIKAMFQTTNQLYYCCRLVDFWLQCFSKPVFLLQPSADSATTLGKIQPKTHGLGKSKQKSSPILDQRCLLHRVHPPIFTANLRYPYKTTS